MPNDVHSVYSLKHSDPFWMLQSTSGGSNDTELNEFAVSASAPDLASATEIRLHTGCEAPQCVPGNRHHSYLLFLPRQLSVQIFCFFDFTQSAFPTIQMLTSKKVPGS